MARRRKRPIADTNNHDRWMVSYADFITLLFAFFVVMYSISSVNEGKYKTLSDSLGEAFSNKEQQGNEIAPIQIGTLPTTIQPIPLENPTAVEVEERRELSEEILKERKQLSQVSGQFEQVLAPFIQDNLVSVKKNDYWIELEMNSEMLFLSGEAELSKKAIPVLQKIVEVINPLPNMVNIEGHTDNIPIDNIKFRSNWDLSSARATSVVHEFVKEGINPPRLSAIGYGEFHPIGDNKIEAGRFKNRRVVLVLMSQAFARYGANDEERAKLLNLAPTATAVGQP
ncbi:flagellar motor protein MotD [Methylobacter tundripaludum]|uniref:OmpA/MotB domain protein n=1 Tax=Methylobacter tundripaludum (strain ATCC BAA-1195 / DSM 17260 / SV96) TaxID=697282 RepID=G3IT66_METTV|nr:flagellar motor protein MotD [Methylobacter tundripaludum]EGW21350.1 OmpA/MotB domain protein [Methylobacter tundripaludum SV96]